MTAGTQPIADLPVRTDCNLCGADDFAVLFAAGMAQLNQVVRCNNCGLMYANPRKPADHLEIESWPDDPNWDFEKEHPQRFEKERLQVRDFASTRELLNRRHPGRGTLLEIGSSLGFLLQSLQTDGWTVLGIEPDRNASRHATGKLGIKTMVSTLNGADLADESVDVVVMLHVIEHLPDPLGTLREIYRLLKPGGRLVLETPRYDTLMFRLLGRRDRSLSCSGHIFFFTTQTLKKACEAAGFVLEHQAYTGRSLTVERLLYNLGVITKSEKVQQIVNAVSRTTRLSKFVLYLNLRDMVRVCLLKPGAS